MKETKRIDLALQGGGAHGAFTWGVMDRLLEDPRIEIEGISGTSAGAMNGVVMADALTRGDRDTARQALHDFWQAVSRAGMASPIRRGPLDILTDNWSLDHSPGYVTMDLMSRLLSPYQLNPFDLNPLRDIVAERVDFERVRRCQDLHLFVTATNVRTGKQRIFKREEMSLDAVMASACLPTVFKAVEIDGEAYWDGGYMGNPSLMPLMENCKSRDIVIVQINPIYREALPTSAAAIMNRLNEITFNASLIKEVRMIAMLQRLLGDQEVDIGCYADTLFHRIIGDEVLDELSISSKMNAEWPFLCHLRDAGRNTAEAWLAEHFPALGHHSTLDVEQVYQTEES
ncbi:MULTISPECIES: patatin-like phospholipase family protein [unclassified Halomonas]|uniref:patatin-like phospholipase family protein n=1 Tax=unclassified Halomonas TaxID=2609666 RepID=UPI0028862725|nr:MULTISPECIES: patatin-like phospholipase family protein [unclassified Halomonas]MDT0501063.1 patatin-like phospholipase family protein [Halomonas sp. PAR7]MDT0513254.1 patatin-like phospholipase family protein [Halomonas sp. LES1]MDT0592234.1 patatin-like phospholipase family protein [Halomonas sp. PAR8]